MLWLPPGRMTDTMNILKNTTALALAMCEQYRDAAGCAVDATCGNGHDTLWLAERFARVYAFDIQQSAVDATAVRLAEAGRNNAELICDSHHRMAQYVKEAPRIIMFNLGYLPGGDKTVSTESGTTMEALEAALQLLAVDGLLCITMYQGHEEGYRERMEILEWAGQLDKGAYHCVHTNMVNQPNRPPEILWITKKKEI